MQTRKVLHVVQPPRKELKHHPLYEEATVKDQKQNQFHHQSRGRGSDRMTLVEEVGARAQARVGSIGPSQSKQFEMSSVEI